MSYDKWTNDEWYAVHRDLPPRGLVVETKIHDERGARNHHTLKLVEGNNLWWTPSGDTYVYYTPTHWRYCE